MLGHRRRLIVALIVMLSAGAAAPVGATPAGRASQVVGPEFRISGPGATAFDWSPAVAANDTNNEYLVVWSDHRGSTGAIYARRIGADGIRIGPDRRVSGSQAIGADHPAVVWNGTAKEYLVVWEDSRNPATASDLYAVRLSPQGSRLAPDRRISSGAAIGGERSPAVAYNPASSRYVVVWSDDRDSTTRGTDIYGRRVGLDGKASGSEFRVSPKGATGTDGEPGISWAWTGTSEFLVVWVDLRNPVRGFDVYGRRLSAAGAPLGGSFRISNAGGGHNEFAPAVAWSSATDEYLVVWEDERRSGTRGTDVYGRRVLDGGAGVGGDFRISGRQATGDDADPGIAYSRTSSEYLVVWSDARSYATRAEDIYGRRVNPSGTPAGNDFRVSGPNALGAESDPRPAFLYDAAGFLVVWSDDRDADTRSYDVWGRRVAG